MEGAGREEQGTDHRKLRRRFGVVAGLLALGLVVGVAPTVGDGLPQQPDLARAPNVDTVPATKAQVAAGNIAVNSAAISASKKKSKKKRRKVKPITFQSRITDSESPILTEHGKGTYVKLACPHGAAAVSGGVLTKYVNLVISASSPNNPINGAYTPRTWWVTVVNADFDGQGGSLGWRGIVNCLSPVKFKK
ncbi:MAG: hypothetical protein IPK93_06020 [Solirubrobacterales bacterium]|nr:hypothetical protein [Solirubrobacterales bacterium]